MARIRTIKPEIKADPDLSKISREARLTFIWLITEADDEGRLVGSPRKLVGNLFPHDHDVTARRLERWLAELVDGGFVVDYEVDGFRYLSITNFVRHQRISHSTPSTLPPPSSGTAPESHRNGGGATPRRLRGGREGKGRDQGREVDGRAPSAPPSRATPLPDDFELSDDLRAWAEREAPGINPDHETKLFLDHHRAKGSTFKDWAAAWRSWMRRAVGYQGSSGGASGAKRGRADDELRAFAARENSR